MRERVGIDLDETVIWLLPSFLKDHFNPKFGTSFSPEKFRSYRWWETLQTTKEQAYAEAAEFVRASVTALFERYLSGEIGSGDWLNYINNEINQRLVPHAEDGIELLAHHYELHGITDRVLDFDPETFELSSRLYFESLERRDLDGLALPHNQIHYAKANGRTKLQICRELEIQTIIDDDSNVALSCADGGVKAVVLERPWNRGMPEHPLVYGVPDWRTACTVVLGKRSNFISYGKSH